MKERVGDEKLIIITVAVRGINDHSTVRHRTKPVFVCWGHAKPFLSFAAQTSSLSDYILDDVKLNSTSTLAWLQ